MLPGNTEQREAMYNRLLWWVGHFAVLGVVIRKADIRCHQFWRAARGKTASLDGTQRTSIYTYFVFVSQGLSHYLAT